MPIAPQQLDFPSLQFPDDRTVLYVGEVARMLRVTEQHVLDLIEEGEIQAVNVGGMGPNTIRVPVDCAEQLSKELGLSLPTLAMALEKIRKEARAGSRKTWRIPIEGYEDFSKRRHSYK